MKNYYLVLLFLFSFGLSFAQTQDSLSLKEQLRREKNIQAGNPFKKFGYKPKISTLSKGKYLEFHYLDSIVQIGSFTFHVKKKIITGYIVKETKYSEATLRPEIVSRWFSPDPLAEEFPDWSPYNFVENNPIRMVDPTGLAPLDIIAIEVGTGEITVTEAAGDDIVRSVDKGKVTNSYTYGKNGSFQAENTVVGNMSEGAQAVVSSNVKKLTEFFEFAADNSNVEFGRLEVSKNERNVSVVSTTFNPENNSFLNDLAKLMAIKGYSILQHSHNHPGQEIGIPSGYFGMENGNPNSLTPIPNFEEGDAEAARIFSKYRQFNNTEFNIYNGKTKTVYDGFNQAKVKPNN